MRGPIILLLLLSAPATAGETAWQDLAPGARARLVTSDALRADGTTLAALEIDMPAGTKTYWRVPGETGIPTQLDFARSTGVTGHRILWPYPMIDTKSGYTDFVYYGRTTLPVELTVEGGAASIEADLVIGICSDICVPATASFSLPLDFATPDRGNGIRIDQAVAEAPIAWDGSGTAFSSVSYDAAADALAVEINSVEIDPASLIAEAGGGGPLFGAPQKSRDGKLVQLPVLAGGAGSSLVGQTVRLTFMTERGSFESVEPIAASTPD